MRLILAQIGDNKTVKLAVKELCRLIKAMDDRVVLDVRKYASKIPSVKNALWVGLDGSAERSENDRMAAIFDDRSRFIDVYSISREEQAPPLRPPNKLLRYQTFSISRGPWSLINQGFEDTIRQPFGAGSFGSLKKYRFLSFSSCNFSLFLV